MIGTLVNVGAIVAGTLLGLLLKKGLPERLSDTVMKGLGLCTLFIGVTGILEGKKTLVLIVSMVLGAIIGGLADLDGKLNAGAKWIEGKLTKKSTDDLQEKKSTFAEGFVTATLLFCVGAMAIVGSLQSGLTGSNETLFTKSILDCVAAIIFTSSFGIGVMLAVAPVFIYQGSITLLAQWISPFLGKSVIAEMTAVGSLLIIGLSFNMLGITKIKVMNYIPAVFLPIILCRFM
jgi:uncharacterized membrane protein YqgA involved in biofilm formation